MSTNNDNPLSIDAILVSMVENAVKAHIISLQARITELEEQVKVLSIQTPKPLTVTELANIGYATTTSAPTIENDNGNITITNTDNETILSIMMDGNNAA